MSKQNFDRLECGKTEKIFAGTWSFNKRVDISSLAERTDFYGESKLEKKIKLMIQTHL